MKNIRNITGIALFSTIIVVLQLITNHFTFILPITLSLIPIALGAIIYGPTAGFILGAINGIVVFFAPSTFAFFVPFNPFLTFILCVLKSGLAGLIAGLLYKITIKLPDLFRVVISSISVPLLNTGIFAIGTLLFFMPVIEKFAGEGKNVYLFFFLEFIGLNFIIEFLINSLLSPTIYSLVKIFNKKFKK